MSPTTQQARILARLKRGDRLTPQDALRDPAIRSMRLGARIYDLRKAGHVINTDRVETENGARVAEYWMPQEARADG